VDSHRTARHAGLYVGSSLGGELRWWVLGVQVGWDVEHVVSPISGLRV